MRKTGQTVLLNGNFIVNAYACKIWTFDLQKTGDKLRQTYENGYPRSLKLNGMISYDFVGSSVFVLVLICIT